MPKGFTQEKRRISGPAEIRARLRREAAHGHARNFLTTLGAALDGQDPELKIEVSRWIIRGLSRAIEANGDLGRAHGILAGAATDLSPAWAPERAEADELAKRTFGRAA